MASDLAALLSRGHLPSLAAIDAEIARRRPLWKPQHATECRYFWARCVCPDPPQHVETCGMLLPMPTRQQWRAEPCTCPQPMAYYSEARITGYGGSAGGGKSALGEGLATTDHRNSAIFRREKDDGHDLFDEVCRMVEGSPARTNENLKLIRDIPGDRQVRFFGVKNPGDEQKYRGRPRDLYVFDEATEFDEEVIRFLIAWNRTTIPGQRCRVLLTFNPPRRKHGQWLKKFFRPWLDRTHPDYPAPSGKLYWYTTIGGEDVECANGDPITVDIDGKEETVQPISRTFVRASLDDNAYLRDTEYRAMLQALPEPHRSMLLHGDMEAEDDDEVGQVIPTKWVAAAFDRWAAQERPTGTLDSVGSDISRGGKDRTTNAARIGTWFDYPQGVPGKETPDGPAVLRNLAKFLGGYRCDKRTVIGMDVIGVGSSPFDIATQMGVQIVAMDAAAGAPDAARDRSGMLRFANNRAYWWWSLREALDPALGLDLAIAPDNEVLVDLTAPRYDVTLRGIVIEAKPSIRKRIRRSTDKGDAIVQAFAVRPHVIDYRTAEPRVTVDDDWGVSGDKLFATDQTSGAFF